MRCHPTHRQRRRLTLIFSIAGMLCVALTEHCIAQFPEYRDAMLSPADVQVIGFGPARNADFAGAPGDVNGDGYDDLLVASWQDPPGRLPVGLYLGSATPPPQLFASADPGLGPVVDLDVSQGDHISHRNENPRVGDLNGDGRDDMLFLVAPPNEFRIVFGRTSWPNRQIHTAQGAADVYIVHPEEGWSMQASMRLHPADYNGDGINDLNQGHQAEFNGQGDFLSGRENVFFGRQNWPYMIDLETTVGDISMFGTTREFVPTTVAAIDLNGDGYDEMIGHSRDLPRDGGQTYLSIVWGASNLPADIEFDGDPMPGIYNEPGGGSGFAFADFTGDGKIDMAVQRGSTVFLYFDISRWTPGSNFNANVEILYPELQPFSTAATYAGDFNGDGIGDLLLIDYYTRVGMSPSIYQQSIHILYGRSLWPAAINLANQFANVTIVGLHHLDYGTNLSPFGLPPNFIADINGDGNDDILLNEDSASLDIILGGPDLPPIIRGHLNEFDFQIANLRIGDAGVPTLDFNGDGIVDIVYRRGLAYDLPLQDRSIEILFGRPAPQHVYVDRTETEPGDGSAQQPYRQLRLGLKTVKTGGTLHLVDGGATTTISFPQRISKSMRISR